MFAVRRVFNDPADTIPVPYELRHRKTEVIFIALEEDFQAEPARIDTVSAMATACVEGKPKPSPRAGWFENYHPNADETDVLTAIPIDEDDGEWTW